MFVVLLVEAQRWSRDPRKNNGADHDPHDSFCTLGRAI
jgi:hypothetical protein